MDYPKPVYELLALFSSQGGEMPDDKIPGQLRNALDICLPEPALIVRRPVAGTWSAPTNLLKTWKLTLKGKGVLALYRETQAERTPPVAECGTQPPLPQEPPRPRLSVDLDRMEITLDGSVMGCDSKQALRVLKVYADHPREWIRAADLKGYDPELDGAKPHVLKKNLPAPVRSLIQSSKQLGSRLCLS